MNFQYLIGLMPVSFEITSTFNCSIERAFQAPMLGDATRFMKGYLFQPPVTGFVNDATWGQENGVRYPVSAGNRLVKKGIMFTDEILERNENKYWRWTIYDFKIGSMFFVNKAIGEWFVHECNSGSVRIIYRYTYFSKSSLFYPITWLFVKIQIRGIMKRAIVGIQEQAESHEPFVYTTT